MYVAPAYIYPLTYVAYGRCVFVFVMLFTFTSWPFFFLGKLHGVFYWFVGLQFSNIRGILFYYNILVIM